MVLDWVYPQAYCLPLRYPHSHFYADFPCLHVHSLSLVLAPPPGSSSRLPRCEELCSRLTRLQCQCPPIAKRTWSCTEYSALSTALRNSLTVSVSPSSLMEIFKGVDTAFVNSVWICNLRETFWVEMLWAGSTVLWDVLSAHIRVFVLWRSILHTTSSHILLNEMYVRSINI